MTSRLFSLPVLLLVGLLAFLYRPTHSLQEALGSDRVLLLTAHPDDECMFFAPTLLALTRTSDQVYSLCLSSGNADGLGEARKRELEASLDILGVAEQKRWLVDHPALQDNFTAIWELSVIASVLEPFVVENGITKIFTFDRQGVSQHPNHKSLPEGVKHLIQHAKTARPLRLYTLISVSLVEKYTSILAPTMSKFDLLFTSATNPLPVTVFVSGFKEYYMTLRAMKSHWSQLVWFRWLYVAFSRYMWVNEWVAVQL